MNVFTYPTGSWTRPPTRVNSTIAVVERLDWGYRMGRSLPPNARSRWAAPARDWPAGSFLARLSPEDRKALLELGATRRYPPRTVLLREGDDTSHIAIIRSGLVKVTAATEGGREVLLAMRTAGDAIGELAAL